MSEVIDLSIVILSWNVRELLKDCIRSIVETSSTSEYRFEIIVVDADSADDSVEMVKHDFPEVTIIELEENAGFSRGNNIGIEASNGRYVLVLNPDTRIVEDALDQLIQYIDDHQQVGVIGPQLLNEDMSVQSSRRRFPTVLTAFFESTWLQPYAPKPILDRYYMNDLPDDEPAEVDWLQGAAFILRRKVVDGVGLLDEGFFMYSEEMDWQKRIKDAGWSVIYYPKAKIVHYGGKSSEQVVAFRDIQFHTSKIRYFEKHHGRNVAFSLRIFLLYNYVFQIGIEQFKVLLGHKREMRRTRIKAYREVLRSGLKPRDNNG